MKKSILASGVALAVAAALIFTPDLAFAQVGEIEAGGQRAVTAVISLIRVIAALLFIAGLLAWSSGRFHWAAAVVMVLCVVAAAKADRLADYIVGA
jgi:VIT1/CCC1 family predicted Fe2+/Mn2+ transporter